MVTFCAYFNTIKMPHAFSLIGYKENKEKNELLIEILNHWHSGDYIGNNIKKNEEYNKLEIGSENKKLFDEEKKGTIINKVVEDFGVLWSGRPVLEGRTSWCPLIFHLNCI